MIEKNKERDWLDLPASPPMPRRENKASRQRRDRVIPEHSQPVWSRMPTETRRKRHHPQARKADTKNVLTVTTVYRVITKTKQNIHRSSTAR